MGNIGRDRVRCGLNLCIGAVSGIAVLLTALLCLLTLSELFGKADIDRLRNNAQSLAADIEKTGEYEFTADFPYAVILNDGTVCYNSGTTLHKKVNLHSVSSANDGFMTVPLLKDNTQQGTLYIEIPPEYYGTGTGTVIGVIFLYSAVMAVIISLYLITLRILGNDIFSPLSQLHSATLNILGGNPDTRVKYDYDGEIGTLCHDFELMRTELRDGFLREKKMKSEEKVLMASISHDLKTPLATVQGYLESICLGIVTSDDEIKRYCESALEKTMLLGKMTNDILEHSKAELCRLSVEPEEVYSADFFGSVLSSLKSDCESRGFTLSYGKIPNMLISLDRTRMTQVMENLVGNSIKYGREKGHIEISFNQKDGYFFVNVSDDGMGIAAEDLPFVFNRFFRGDKSRTQNISGSGLGLSIVKYIVERHGGTIECDSVLGKGTTVEFNIKCG